MSIFYNTKELVGAFPSVFSESNLKKSRMDFSDVVGPPFIRAGRKIVYCRDDVLNWLDSLSSRGVAKRDGNPSVRSPNKIGRPTKAQQIARRSSAG